MPRSFSVRIDPESYQALTRSLTVVSDRRRSPFTLLSAAGYLKTGPGILCQYLQ